MGAPADVLEELRAAWLSTDPARWAGERLRDGAAGVVVSGGSAAAVHRIGDLRSGVHEFTVGGRKQSQRTDLRYRRRSLPDSSITIVRGLPVTTAGQTLADLVNEDVDLTLVAQGFRDAVNNGLRIEGMAGLITNAAARRHGMPDPQSLVDRLTRLAGVDDKSLAEAVLRTDAGALAVAELLIPDTGQASQGYISALQMVIRGLVEQLPSGEVVAGSDVASSEEAIRQMFAAVAERNDVVFASVKPLATTRPGLASLVKMTDAQRSNELNSMNAEGADDDG